MQPVGLREQAAELVEVGQAADDPAAAVVVDDDAARPVHGDQDAHWHEPRTV